MKNMDCFYHPCLLDSSIFLDSKTTFESRTFDGKPFSTILSWISILSSRDPMVALVRRMFAKVARFGFMTIL